MAEFKKLFEPTRIGTMRLRNRIVMPPMNEQLASEYGAVTERMINYYAERAKGGVALIEIGAVCIDEEVGRMAYPQLSIDGYKYTAGLSDLVDEVHKHGAKICPQLHHAGYKVVFLEATKGKQPVAPSDIASPYIPGVRARALTVREIEDIVEKYAKAASLARHAGFDGVEVQAAHGTTLVSHFLSSLTNTRTDEYGGDLQGRAKFALDILKGIKEKLGRDFPVIFRLSGDEYMEGGITLEDSKVIAKNLEEAGVDALHISAGNSSAPESFWYLPPMDIPHGCHVHLAEKIKDVVNVPVITVGRINDPEVAEKILQAGKADLVAMGRALIADPELPKKAAEGRLDDIRKCIGCLQDCDAELGLRVKCAVNAAIGKEKEYKIKPVEKPEKVLVVGGGPAGMEAARVASLRGHDVILFEKSGELGGQLRLSQVIPHKEDVKSLTNFLVHQIEKLGVRVELEREVTPDLVVQIKPDVVIVATGATPLIPSIPGVNGKNVVTAWDVLRSQDKNIVGEKVIIAGGGGVGCETAEFLINKGKKVTIIEMLGEVAIDLPTKRRYLLKQRLLKSKVKILTKSKIEEIIDRGVIIYDEKGNKQIVSADTVVLALGAIPNKEIIERLKGKVPKLYAVGDCVHPRRILEAVHEGSSIAREI